MQYQQFVLLAAVASTALANPLSLAKRVTQEECTAQNNACVTAPNANLSFCASQHASCISAAAAATASSTVPTGPAPTSSAATCDSLRLDCGSKYLANQSLCAVQKSACDDCEAAYEAYITSANSNKAYAASFRAACFEASTIEAGDGVAPLLSSISAAEGLTPSTSASLTSSTSVVTSVASSVVATTTPTVVSTSTAIVKSTTTAAPSGVASGTGAGSLGTTVGSKTTGPKPTSSAVFPGAAVAIQPAGALAVLMMGAAALL